MYRIKLLLNCQDQRGIILAVTSFIYKNNGNIVYVDQYVENHTKGIFFMRLECDFEKSTFDLEVFKTEFKSKLALKYRLRYKIYDESDNVNMAIFVSKYKHCLYDVLAKYTTDSSRVKIPMIISNHEDLKFIAQQFDIPFYHVPVSKKNKLEAEQKQINLLKEANVNLIVLARYMQILSAQFVEKYAYKIINIHHSFLPAFPGSKPYHSAYKRGVKIIGATSHYVNQHLDEGPIIEQDIMRVSHLHSVKDLIRIGGDLERMVLLRAITLHIDRKIMPYDNKTIIFS